MDWNGTIETVRNASALYWVAAAAIAAGASLLAAALMLHLRRHPPQRDLGGNRTAKRPPSAVAVPGGYVPAAVPAATPAPARIDLSPVTARLAAAADRLAAIETELDAEHRVPGGSVLKETPSHVEYVFRTGEA